jgi:hypothetical protein
VFDYYDRDHDEGSFKKSSLATDHGLSRKMTKEMKEEVDALITEYDETKIL